MSEDGHAADAGEPDPDGRTDRLPDQPDRGQPAGDLEADRLVRAEPDQPACRGATRGAGRRVYPGFMQLSAFMSMNKERHADAFRAYYRNLVADEREKAEVTRAFYAEYMAVSDLSADFYLETVRLVFQEYALPLGQLSFRGRPVDLEGDPPHRAPDDRGREGRHLLDRPDPGGARPVHRPQALPAHPLRAGRRRPLRRLQRQALAEPDLPGGARRHPRLPVSRTTAPRRAPAYSFDAGMKAPVPPLASGAAGAGSPPPWACGRAPGTNRAPAPPPASAGSR